jgi:hypothetical protein
LDSWADWRLIARRHRTGGWCKLAPTGGWVVQVGANWRVGVASWRQLAGGWCELAPSGGWVVRVGAIWRVGGASWRQLTGGSCELAPTDGWGGWVVQTGAMLVISRFRYDEELAGEATADLETCREWLSACPGYLTGIVGRAVDDPALWVLATTWEHVGAYRRALASYDVKLNVVPLLGHALDEPSAYEVIGGVGATTPNETRPREIR